MHVRLLGISGRKGAGKDTLARFIKLCNRGILPCETFAFADELKKFCVDVLGVGFHQVWGTDEQKNTPVPHLLWENFPVPVFDLPDGSVYVVSRKHNPQFFRFVSEKRPEGLMDRLLLTQGTEILMQEMDYGDRSHWPSWKTGPMTGREVAQYWGTDVFRAAYGNVWIDSAFRKVKRSDTCQEGGVCVLTDCRFINEASRTQKEGGRILRLTRRIAEDAHESESALDDFDRFDHTIDNQHLSAFDTLYAAYPKLRQWGIVPTLRLEQIEGYANEALGYGL